MADHLLYAQVVPGEAKTRASQTYEQRLSLQSALDSEANVQVLGSNPGTRTLRVQYRGYDADRLARQLDALFDASDMGEVAYYGIDDAGTHTTTPEDGYYALDSTDSAFPDPRLRNLPYAKGRLRPVGTRKSHFRQVTTTPYTPEQGNPFGSQTTAHFGVAPSAQRVRWWSRNPYDWEAASPTATRTTAWGPVDVYDATAASFDDPSLVFDLPYEAEGKFDPVVWDDRGYDTKFGTVDGEQVRNWEHLYRTKHEPDGQFIVSNGLVRYFFDEATESLSVEQYTNGSWTSVSLGDGNGWSLVDLDLREVSQQRVWGYVTFSDGSTTADLRLTLQSGYEWAQFTPPSYESGAPSDLVALLDPVANAQTIIPGAKKTLVERNRVTPT